MIKKKSEDQDQEHGFMPHDLKIFAEKTALNDPFPEYFGVKLLLESYNVILVTNIV